MDGVDRMRVELEREDDGRWRAEIAAVPGAMRYGRTPSEAILLVRELARDVLDGFLRP